MNCTCKILELFAEWKTVTRIRRLGHFTAIDIFPNKENWRISNWQIATDTLIAIIVSWVFWDIIHFCKKHK